MWKFLNLYRNLGMEDVNKVMHAKGNDIDVVLKCSTFASFPLNSFLTSHPAIQFGIV